jgi:hypothetical protein
VLVDGDRQQIGDSPRRYRGRALIHRSDRATETTSSSRSADLSIFAKTLTLPEPAVNHQTDFSLVAWRFAVAAIAAAVAVLLVSPSIAYAAHSGKYNLTVISALGPVGAN